MILQVRIESPLCYYALKVRLAHVTEQGFAVGLIRLVGFDCGSGNWGQTFSFNDAYDNITKAVITNRTGTAWNPGYSATTNHYSIGSYNSDGNVTSDGNYSYGWTEFAKLKWEAASGT